MVREHLHGSEVLAFFRVPHSHSPRGENADQLSHVVGRDDATAQPQIQTSTLLWRKSKHVGLEIQASSLKRGLTPRTKIHTRLVPIRREPSSCERGTYLHIGRAVCDKILVVYNDLA